MQPGRLYSLHICTVHMEAEPVLPFLSLAVVGGRVVRLNADTQVGRQVFYGGLTHLEVTFRGDRYSLKIQFLPE